MNRSAIVLGSTGLVGSCVVRKLLADNVYKNIILINRRPSGIQHEKIQEIITDFSNFDFMNGLIPVHSIFSCLGTTRKKTPDLQQYEFIEITIPKTIVQRSMIKGQLNAVHAVSAIGAQKGASNFYIDMKGRLEEALTSLEVPRTFLYRPALILGDRKNDKRTGERIAMAIMPIFDKFCKGKWSKYHSIPAQTIAASMLYNDVNVFVNGANILEYDDMQLGIYI